MTDGPLNPIDLSADAILELEELRQGKRTDAPQVTALFDYLRTPAPAPLFQGQGSISMLADVRSHALLRASVGPGLTRTATSADFQKQVELYLQNLEKGVAERRLAKINEAKRFCVALNVNLLSRKLDEIYRRRERSGIQYMSRHALS